MITTARPDNVSSEWAARIAERARLVVSLNEATDAIYIDFEGGEDKEPRFLESASLLLTSTRSSRLCCRRISKALWTVGRRQDTSGRLATPERSRASGKRVFLSHTQCVR